MKVEFPKVIIPDEIPALLDFDKKAFHDRPADVFSEEAWKEYESYWMVVDGEVVGCAAFDETNKDELWIASTAILPELQGRGLGRKFKEWQIQYARANGFKRIGTVMRPSNARIIKLNGQFGFKPGKMRPNLYDNPVEDGIEMELLL